MNKSETERIAVIETKLSDHIKQNDKDNREIKEMLKDINVKFDNLDKKFAPKITLYLATGSFLTALGIIGTLIMVI